jgi:hypothetical protein
LLHGDVIIPPINVGSAFVWLRLLFEEILVTSKLEVEVYKIENKQNDCSTTREI